MATPSEIQRLAAVMHTLRPEWPIGSLITTLNNHGHRPYFDLTMAAVYVALDQTTRTPALIHQQAPWTFAGRCIQAGGGATTNQPPRPSEACPIDGHGSFLAHNCGACRGEQLGKPREPEPPSEVQVVINREGREMVRRAVMSRADGGT